MVKKLHVLLVEDTPLAQKVGEMILEKNHCQVTIATNGEEAITYCQKQDYDLIIMDIGLPGIDGITTVKRIRQIEDSRHHIPIVALTAHDDEMIKTQALQAGMDGYCVKPLTAKSVKIILKKYLCAERKTNLHPNKKY